jgi:hypothetical protein
LKEAAKKGEIELVPQPVELLDPSFVSDLSSGDLLFVDSTHTLGPAGEVSRIILELLPRLNSEVYVHFHDILFPYDYPGNLLTTALFVPHESVLLHAFLTCNPRFTILASLSMLHYQRPDELRKLLPTYSPAPYQDGIALGDGHFPSAIYLRVLS